MAESILESVKRHVGIDTENTDFDNQLVDDINTALLIAYQLGVGSKPYKLSSKSETWSEMFKATSQNTLDDESDYPLVQKYVTNKVKQLFDPGGVSSSVNSALNEQNAELEWRINNSFDRKEDL